MNIFKLVIFIYYFIYLTRHKIDRLFFSSFIIPDVEKEGDFFVTEGFFPCEPVT